MSETKKYLVRFYVWSDIEIEVETDKKYQEEILQVAIEKAIIEEPKVSWLHDENSDYSIEELENE